MKKIEAESLSVERSKLIIEYITQILTDSVKVNGKIIFNYQKIDNQNMCVLDIYVLERDFEKHLNLGITTDHYLVLLKQLLNDLLDNFLEHETIGVTKYYSIKSMQENFTGINAVNSIGSKIKINLNASGSDFQELISDYNQKYEDFVNENKKSR